MGLSNLILELVAWVSILLVQVALLCLMHHGILATMFKLFAGNLWTLIFLLLFPRAQLFESRLALTRG